MRASMLNTLIVIAGLGVTSAAADETRRESTATRSAIQDSEERSLADKILDTLASVQVPGTAAWARMGVEARAHWWVYRVGRFTTLIAAIPGLGGALARTLPVSDAVGAAGREKVMRVRSPGCEAT